MRAGTGENPVNRLGNPSSEQLYSLSFVREFARFAGGFRCGYLRHINVFLHRRGDSLEHRVGMISTTSQRDDSDTGNRFNWSNFP
jgi:hypothetical protein